MHVDSSARRTWAAVVAGIVWAQGAIAMELLVLPKYVALGERIADGWSYRLASWTLLAPFSLASQLSTKNVAAIPSGGVMAEPDLITLLMCPVFGVGLCLATTWVLGLPRWQRRVARVLVVAAVLAVGSGTTVALQFSDAVDAEKAYFAMVSRVDSPHKDPATVSAARGFAQRHPDSRWAGEALRIVAMAEWESGRFESASRLWSSFAERFRDRRAPGVAYAEYSIALCDERLGEDLAAQQHLRAAIEVIRARGDGIQAWIATEAAIRLAAFERAEGRYALAGYWKTKSQTFADVYSTE